MLKIVISSRRNEYDKRTGPLTEYVVLEHLTGDATYYWIKTAGSKRSTNRKL
jgi:hypothetical protein